MWGTNFYVKKLIFQKNIKVIYLRTVKDFFKIIKVNICCKIEKTLKIQKLNFEIKKFKMKSKT
jgi:hypothetical protein